MTQKLHNVDRRKYVKLATDGGGDYLLFSNGDKIYSDGDGLIDASSIAAAGGLTNTSGIALLSTTTVPTDGGTVLLYTVPAGKVMIPAPSYVRNASMSLAGYDAANITGAARISSDQFNWLTDSTAVVVTGPSTDGYFAIPPGTAVIIEFGSSSVAGTVVIDLFGYLIAA